MAQTIVDELVTLLGFRMDPGAHPTLAKFSTAIEEVGHLASIAAASITAAAGSFLYFAEKSASAGAEIERFHQLTGMSTDSIQMWSYAAQQVSGNKQSVLQDIERITAALNPILPQQFNQGMFLMFGERLKSIKDVNQAFREMAKIFPTLSPQKAMQWGNLIGISPETVLLLRQGEEGLDKLFKKVRGRILSPEETREALKYAQAWSDIKDRMARFAEHLAIRFFPLVEKIVDKMISWWEANQRMVNSGLQKFVEGVAEGVERFLKGLERAKTLLPFIGAIFELFLDPRVISGTVVTALMGVAVALGVIAAKYVLIGSVILTAITALEAFKDPDSWVNRKRWEEYSSRPDWVKRMTPGWATPTPPSNPQAPMPSGPVESLRSLLQGLSQAPAFAPVVAAPPQPQATSPAASQPATIHHTQTVEIHIDGAGRSSYATSDEALRKLESIPRTDYKALGPASPVN